VIGTVYFSDIRPPAHTQYMYSTNIVEKVMWYNLTITTNTTYTVIHREYDIYAIITSHL